MLTNLFCRQQNSLDRVCSVGNSWSAICSFLSSFRRASISRDPFYDMLATRKRRIANKKWWLSTFHCTCIATISVTSRVLVCVCVCLYVTGVMKAFLCFRHYFHLKVVCTSIRYTAVTYGSDLMQKKEIITKLEDNRRMTAMRKPFHSVSVTRLPSTGHIRI